MLALLTAVARPSVHVDIDATGDELRGWLVVRLSEEGFELVPDGAPAEVDLRVARERDAWVVRANAIDHQSYRVSDGPENLQRLEVLHRAVAAAEEVEPRAIDASEATAIPRVAIDLDPAAQAEAREQLAAQVTLAVLAAGARVAAPGAAHDRRVCAAQAEAGVVLGSGEASCTAVEVVAIGEAPQWIAKAVAEPPSASAVVEPASAAEVEPAEPTAEAAPGEKEPEATPEESREASVRAAIDPPRVSEAQRRRLVLRVGARGGLVARVRPVDGAVGADLTLGRFAGASLWLDMQVWPSRGSAANLVIVETVPAVGVRWRFLVHDRVSLGAGALVGVAVHAYRSDTRRGTVADISGEVGGGVGVRVVRSLEVGLEVRGGLVGRDRAHQVAGESAWARDAWRWSACLGLSWGFDLRRAR